MCMYTYIRGWSNTVGNLNEGVRVTTNNHRGCLTFGGGRIWHMLVHILSSFLMSLTFSITHMFKSPFHAMLPHMTTKQVCWAPPQVLHTSDMIVSPGAQSWP